MHLNVLMENSKVAFWDGAIEGRVNEHHDHSWVRILYLS